MQPHNSGQGHRLAVSVLTQEMLGTGWPWRHAALCLTWRLLLCICVGSGATAAVLWAHSCFLFSTERHDALYVVGALDEAMELRGMRYHPIDIETSVIRAHKSVTEW